jgi:hypothetical protein
VFVTGETADSAGTLTPFGCVGPFELASTDQTDRAEVVYLRIPDAVGSPVYRFEAVPTFEIEFEVTERPQTIIAADDSYRLIEVWQPSLYSSTTVILFVADEAEAAPEVIYAVDVSQTPGGDAVGEYRLSEDTAQPSEQATSAAEGLALNQDLSVNGLFYDLVDVFTPAGTTRNGFVTLFQSVSDGAPAVLLGRDVRKLDELFIFAPDTPAR